MKKTPRPHQKDAIKAITKSLQTNDRSHALMACGTGKTITALWVAEKLKSKTIVIFVPSLSLINQFMKEWLAQHSWKSLSVLVICSDDTVANGVEPESVLIEDIDFPVTNNQFEIKRYLKSCRNNTSTNLIFCTYHSSYLLCDAAGRFELDLAIFDEAHKTAGYNKTMFGAALSQDNIKIKKRLFLTATPRHGTARKDKNGDHELLYSMDDESIYGPRAYTLDFRKAINLGLICDYKIIISVLNYDRAYMSSKEQEHIEKMISLQKAIKEVDAKKIITFHSTIYDAGKFSSMLRQNNIHPNIAHINSDQTVAIRNQLMTKFRSNNKALLTNARCLTEGIDVPSVDMVAFLNPKSSKIDIVQAIGRALRVAPGKERGYIFLPVLVPDGIDAEGWIPTTEFRSIWEVLNALMEQDADLADAVKNLARPGDGENDSSTIWDDFDSFVAGFSDDRLKKLIKVHVLDKLVESWELRFDELLAFKEKYGHTRVPLNKENIKLFIWVKNQKTRKDSMALFRRKMLDDIGFDWGRQFVKSVMTWQDRYEQLIQFKEKNGHVIIPARTQEHAGLRRWIENEKNKIRNQKSTPDKIKLLSDLGVSFESESIINFKTWQQRFLELKRYKNNFNTTNVSQHDPHFKALGKWVCAQREEHKLGILLPARLEQLNKIDFEFDPLMTKWKENLAEYTQAVKEGIKLSKKMLEWSHVQRVAYRNGKLSIEKISLFLQSGCEFETSESKKFRYDSMLISTHGMWDSLIVYHKINKTWIIHKNQGLSDFVKRIRQAYRDHKLYGKSIKLLTRLGFEWHPTKVYRKRAVHIDTNYELKQARK